MLGGGVGYVRILRFGSDTTRGVRDALTTLRNQQAKAIVLDLRDNGGGLMKAAAEVADLFLPAGKLIVYSKGRNPTVGEEQRLLSSDEVLWGESPLVVLLDGGSASAAEIVAGALRQHQRARIIGTHSFGKGTVQQPLQLEANPEARIKLTVARYYLPDGSSIDAEYDADGRRIRRGGIAPDVEVHPQATPGWHAEVRAQLNEQQVFRQYLDQHYPQHRELLMALADNDGRDPTRYPELAALHAKLNTSASLQDLRTWLREALREHVADDRGVAYVHDLIEDRQLQSAVLELCKTLGVEASTIDAFGSFARDAATPR
jgi:hypothetical protein